MKKIFKILKYIIIIWLVVWNFNHWSWYLTRNKFGYFKHSNHIYLYENGLRKTINNILDIENNKFIALYSSDSKYDSLVYDIKKDTSKYVRFNSEIDYTNDGLALDKDRILLINVNIKKEYSNNNKQYKYIAIINTNTEKIEQIFEKKSYKHIKEKVLEEDKYIKTVKYIKLESGNIAIIYPLQEVIEIYYPKTNSSKIIYVKQAASMDTATLIPAKNNNILIFNSQHDNKNTFITEYDDNTGTIKQVGKIIARDYTDIIRKINDNEILIMGGYIPGKYNLYGYPKPCTKIEIYNIKKNKSKVIANADYIKKSLFYRWEIDGYDASAINKRYVLISCSQRIKDTSWLETILYIGLFYLAPAVNQYFEWEINQAYVLDTKKHKIYRGPKMDKYYESVNLYPLKNGYILLSGNEVLLFKPKKGIRNK